MSSYRSFVRLFELEWYKLAVAGGAILTTSTVVATKTPNDDFRRVYKSFVNTLNMPQVPSILGKIHAESFSSQSQVESSSAVKLVNAKDSPENGSNKSKKVAQLRFDKFASMMYQNGEVIMSPMDFIESVTQSDPRPRIGRRTVNENDLKNLLSGTPKVSKKVSTDFFRKLDSQGVITFPEYCFLIACLAKTRTNIEIAYKVFDRDNSSKIEKNEFEQFADAVSNSSQLIENRDVIPRTTLSDHFFGKNGNGKLGFDQFLTFIRNLQTEILQVEFTEYSKGLKTISEDEFAQILLRHTMMPAEEQAKKLEHLMNSPHTSFKGVTFEEFCQFFYFINNIDDFTVAVKMYAYAGQHLTKEAFQRAYKITTHGKEIPSNILDTIFLLFDKDNDGELSMKEFIGQMKDAVQRGFRYHHVDYQGLSGFQRCVAHEVKMSNRN